MHNLDDFVLGSRLKGRHKWLLPFAKLAHQYGKELTVEDDGTHDPMIRVTDLETQKWLELSMDGNTEDSDIERLIKNFPDLYTQLVPVEDEQELESLTQRIVDVLLEADPDEFLADFSQSQERLGGRPLNPAPTGKKVLRAVEFDTGHKLYVWRTTNRREHYGMGQHSFYLGYRFVSPTGQIIFEDSGFHPGGSWHGQVDNDAILMLIQGLSTGRDNLDEEDEAKLTPEQTDWIDSVDRERIEMDVAGHDGFEEGYPAPWKDLPGHEYNPQAA